MFEKTERESGTGVEDTARTEVRSQLFSKELASRDLGRAVYQTKQLKITEERCGERTHQIFRDSDSAQLSIIFADISKGHLLSSSRGSESMKNSSSLFFFRRS